MRDILEKQRTFALLGSTGTGKTSLAEMIFFNVGVTTRLGTIPNGNTVLDYEPEEIKKGGSIQPAFGVYTWKKNRHFLIDTPGDSNFQGELPYQIVAADGILYVLDATDGVKPQDKKLWNEAKEFELPTIIVINKMDRERADFEKALKGIQDVLKAKPMVKYYPIGAEADFKGVVDVLEKKAYFFKDNGKIETGDIPADLTDKIDELYEYSIENIAESDEELMEKYLEEGELGTDDIISGLRKGVLSGEIVPVCAVSALQNKGAETHFKHDSRPAAIST